MRVSLVSNIYNPNHDYAKVKSFAPYTMQRENIGSNQMTIPSALAQVYFTAKPFDTEAATKKLQNGIDKLLKTKDSDLSEKKEQSSGSINKILSEYEEIKALIEIYETIMFIKSDKRLNEQQRRNSLNPILKDLYALKNKKKQKVKPKAEEPTKSIDERIDYCLLTEFKTALLKDNYNLDKVFLKYYSKLSEITSVKELNEVYPKIQVPKNPAQVIANKIENNFTRDFYINLDSLLDKNGSENIDEYITNEANIILDSYENFYQLPKDLLKDKCLNYLLSTIKTRYYKMKKEDNFSSAPEFRKSQYAKLSSDDIKMVSFDYDRMVLDIIKTNYLNNEKISNITYSENGKSIKLSSICDNVYKFKGASEKIKRIIQDAKTIQAAMRNYPAFSVEQLKSCINKYIETKDIQSDLVFEKFVDFGTCEFHKDDIKFLIMLLREFDKYLDGEQSIEDVEKSIIRNNIEPKGTIKLKNQERFEYEQDLKQKHKESSKLIHKKEVLAELTGVLYANGYSDIAQACSTFEPKTSDGDENYDFVIALLTQHIKDGEVINPRKLSTDMARFEVYENHKDRVSAECLSNAKKFAGNDKIKIGQYILNYTKALSYLQSSNEDDDVLKLVMEKTHNDVSSTAKYLCKFDEYSDLEDNEKSHLSTFIDKFSQNDEIEKALIKYIIENEYLNVETISEIANSNMYGIITPKAKAEIFNQYMFPKCIKYFRKFEEALCVYAPQASKAGCKDLGINNNANKGLWELKIMGYPDRLLSEKVSGDKIIFIGYIKDGLHK